MNNGRIAGFFAALVLPWVAAGQPAPQVIPLWQNGAPGFESLKDVPEAARDYWVRNVNNPSVTVFPAPAEMANGCAVVIFPGGGFKELVFDREGRDAAAFLNGLGVTAFVVKYRLPKADKSPYTMANVAEDAYRAMRTVRSRAAQFHVDPSRIGVLGFSAGGGVVRMVAFDKGDGDPSAADPIDRVNGRPNFEMYVYPGEDPKLPKVMPADAPPAFLLAADDDEYSCDEVALQLLAKFKDAGVPVEAHFIARGKHAFNMGDRSPYVAIRNWPQRMAEWLGDSGLLKASPP
jgi:acetyl esterase/lipase